MPLFEEHERIVVCNEPTAGLRAVIAVHNTVLGPGLGGIRMWPFASDELALTDVLRLSRGMTYKNSLAGLPLGGGNTVVIRDSRTQKTPQLFRALGRLTSNPRLILELRNHDDVRAGAAHLAALGLAE